MKTIIVSFLGGGIISFFLVQSCIKIFPKLNLTDFPDRYGIKRKKLPYPLGIVFLLLFFVTAFFSRDFLILSFPLLLLFVISLIDDLRPLSAKIRLPFHIISASLIYFLGVKINFITDPFHSTNFELSAYPILSFLITVSWIVIISNSINWIDGLPGLAIGISSIGFLVLGILGLVRPELFFDSSHMMLTEASFFLSGICAGGLYFFIRKKCLLGDSGSQILGFLLATFSIFAGAKIATTLIVLALPMIDALVVVLRRIRQKKSPFRGDLSHLHHNFAKKFGEKKTVFCLLLLSAALGITALFFSGFSKMISLGLIIILILFLDIWVGKNSQLSKTAKHSKKL